MPLLQEEHDLASSRSTALALVPRAAWARDHDGLVDGGDFASTPPSLDVLCPRRKGDFMKRTILALAAAACLLPMFATPTASATSHPALPQVQVLSVDASPHQVSPYGGTSTIKARVKNATNCQLQLLSRQDFPVIYASSRRACKISFTSHVTIGANLNTITRTIAFALVARNATSSFTAYFSITLPSLPAPFIASVSASPQQLGQLGGNPTIRASIKNAKSCQLKLMSQQSFSVIYSTAARPCGTSFTAHVTVSANPTAVHRSIAFALIARDGSSSFKAYFYIGLAGYVPPAAATTTLPFAATTTTPAATTTTPAATTTEPAATTTVPPSATTTVASATTGIPMTSSNWSGYAATGGPFTGASATFTVPYVTTAASCAAHLSVWVGIDGFNPPGTPEDTQLIQAGVGESETDPTTGECTPGYFSTWPWWEVLPAAEVVPDDWQGSPISAGDTVTVTIGQVSGDTWAMELTDETGGGSFVQDATFDGSEATVEWIVEASESDGDCSGVCPLAEYTNSSDGEPGVVFTNLGVTGTDNNWYQIDMVQNGMQVSTPSNYTTNGSGSGVTGFSVSYTGEGGSTIQPALRRAGGIVKGKFKFPLYQRMALK